VALTRARLGLILLGNPRVLSKNALWAALLVHFKDYDCLVEGPLNNLQSCFMAIQRPRRNPAADSRYAFTALARGAWDGMFHTIAILFTHSKVIGYTLINFRPMGGSTEPDGTRVRPQSQF
jgi:hypothetical protein